jgi:hypothetical protein
MQVYSVPDPIAFAEPDYKNYDTNTELAREEAHKVDLKAWLQTNGWDGPLTGQIRGGRWRWRRRVHVCRRQEGVPHTPAVRRRLSQPEHPASPEEGDPEASGAAAEPSPASAAHGETLSSGPSKFERRPRPSPHRLIASRFAVQRAWSPLLDAQRHGELYGNGTRGTHLGTAEADPRKA